MSLQRTLRSLVALYCNRYHGFDCSSINLTEVSLNGCLLAVNSRAFIPDVQEYLRSWHDAGPMQDFIGILSDAESGQGSEPGTALSCGYYSWAATPEESILTAVRHSAPICGGCGRAKRTGASSMGSRAPQ